MHNCLRCVGFSRIRTKKEEAELLRRMEAAPPSGGADRERHEADYAEMLCELGDGFGVILHGYRDDDRNFHREYYFPYMMGLEMLPMEDGFIRRHVAEDSYAVLCEEYRMGSSLIFYLINGIEYRERLDSGRSTDLKGFYLTGMAPSGTILLPIRKTEQEREKIRDSARTRSQMMEAAREGDETAIESLTMDDLNLYGQISERVRKEDIYSIVDSSFMPSGVECDSYMILGEILQCDVMTNVWSGEKIWRLQVECNGVRLTVCVNSEDLLGEPKIGRRFKGDIWLQGYGVFDDEPRRQRM